MASTDVVETELPLEAPTDSASTTTSTEQPDVTTSVSGNLYEDRIPPTFATDKLAVREEATLSLSNGEDIAESVNVAEAKGVEQIDEERRGLVLSQARSALTQQIQATPAERQDIIRQVFDVATSVEAEALAQSNTLVGRNIAYLKEFPNSAFSTSEELADAAVDMATMQMFSQQSDEKGLLSLGWDLAGMILWPDDSWNAGAINADVAGQQQTFVDWVDSADGLTEISRFRASLAPAQRAHFDATVIIPAIKGVEENNFLQQMDLLGRILEVNPEQEGVLQTVEKLGLVGSALGFAKKVAGGVKALNVLNTAAKVNHPEIVSIIAETVKKQPMAGKDIGLSVGDAHTVGLPVENVEKVFKGVPPGAQKDYRAVMEGVDEALSRLDNVFGYSIAPDDADKAKLVTSLKKNLNLRPDIEDVNITQGKEGLFVNYKMIKNGKVEDVKYQMDYLLDDIGKMNITKASLVKAAIRGFLSPNTMLSSDRAFFVQSAESSLHASARVSKSYGAAIDASLKPIKGDRASLQKLDMLMRDIDGKKNVDTTYQGLTQQGYGGVTLTDKEFAAYSGVRRTLDDAHRLNDQNLIRSNQIVGNKKVSIGSKDFYAKPFDEPDSALAAFNVDAKSTRISVIHADGATEAVDDISSEVMKDWYNKGYVLTKMGSGNQFEWFDGARGLTKYGLVRKEAISNLPAEGMLAKVPNYLPKLRKDANFFVKRKTKVLIDGKEIIVPKAVAYGQTQQQLRVWLAKQEAMAEETGEVFNRADFDIIPDKDFGKGTDSDVITINGGLVNGKRSSTSIEYAGDVDDDVNRVDAINALQKYFSITADRTAMSEWRAEAKARVLNQAADFPEIGPVVKENWDAARDLISKSNLDKGERGALLAAYDQVQAISNVPTAGEQAFQGMFTSIGKRFDRPGKAIGLVDNESIAKFMYKIDDKNPTNLLKSAVFNTTLGAFNLGQIAVQAAGATVALTVSPVSASKAMHKWLISSALDLASKGNEAVSTAALKKILKGMGIKDETLVTDYNMWQRSGLRDSIVNANADVASTYNKIPYDAGVLRRGFHALAEVGQTPYKMGELASMRISFFTALEDVKKLRGAAFKYSDEDMTEVLARTEQFRLNMGAANKAAFQKGLASVPTQFKQIYTKYLEAIAGNWFTKREKTQLVLGQIGLFGAVGVPIVGSAGDTFTKFMYGEDATFDEATLVKKGLMGWALNDELGVNSLFSERLTVSANLTEEFANVFGSEGQPLTEAATGASFSLVYRIGSSFEILAEGATDTLHSEDKLETMLATAQILGRSLLDIPAGTRHLLAAVDLTGLEPVVRGRSGNIRVEQQELVTTLARAAGFGLDTINDGFKGSKAVSDLKKMHKAEALRVIRLINGFVSAATRDDATELERRSAAKALGIHKQTLFTRYPKDAKIIWKMVKEDMLNLDTFEAKSISRILNAEYSDLGSSELTTNILVKKEVADLRERSSQD